MENLPARGRVRLSILAGAALAIIAAIRIVSTYHVFNQTWDEPMSISCGMEWLERGTYTRDPKHPPLGRVAAALGLYLKGVRSTGADHPTLDGNGMLGSGETYRERLTLARLGVLPFFLLSCAVVWAWTFWAFGWKEAAIAVLLFSSMPPVLGHAGIAMTDIALVATLSLALFSFCLWLDRPSTARSVLLGAAGGLAILSKLTAVAFLPVCAVLIIAARLVITKRLDLPRLAVGSAIAGAVAVVVIWAGYRFSFTPLFTGLRMLQLNNEAGRANYFLGRRSFSGWPYFYPVMLAVKSPVAFTMLLLSGVALARKQWRLWAMIAAAAGMLAVGAASTVNTGLRHLLAIYVPLAGIAAFAAVRLLGAGAVARAACVLLLGWHLVSSAAAHPDYLAYFNELAPGENGRFGVDSDLDYGQDLWRLKAACARHQVQSLWVAYNGSADLDVMGLPGWQMLPPNQRQEGWIAASIYRLKLGTVEDLDAYAWIEQYKPVELVGKSIRLYFIPPGYDRK